MGSDLIQRMEETRQGISLACKSDLLAEHEAIQIVLRGVSEHIGMWQSEIMRMERELKTLKREEDFWQQAYRDDIDG